MASTAAFVERQDWLARGVEPLGNGEAPLPRHQRHRLLHVDVVLLEAALRPHLDGIAEALGRHQRGPCALALDQRVGGERGAVNDQCNVRGRDAAGLHRLGEGLAHPFLGRVGRRQHLRRDPLRPALQHDIGEGAADIDADPNPRVRTCHYQLPPESGARPCPRLRPRSGAARRRPAHRGPLRPARRVR